MARRHERLWRRVISDQTGLSDDMTPRTTHVTLGAVVIDQKIYPDVDIFPSDNLYPCEE